MSSLPEAIAHLVTFRSTVANVLNNRPVTQEGLQAAIAAYGKAEDVPNELNLLITLNLLNRATDKAEIERLGQEVGFFKNFAAIDQKQNYSQPVAAVARTLSDGKEVDSKLAWKAFESWVALDRARKASLQPEARVVAEYFHPPKQSRWKSIATHALYFAGGYGLSSILMKKFRSRS